MKKTFTTVKTVTSTPPTRTTQKKISSFFHKAVKPVTCHSDNVPLLYEKTTISSNDTISKKRKLSNVLHIEQNVSKVKKLDDPTDVYPVKQVTELKENINDDKCKILDLKNETRCDKDTVHAIKLGSLFKTVNGSKENVYFESKPCTDSCTIQQNPDKILSESNSISLPPQKTMQRNKFSKNLNTENLNQDNLSNCPSPYTEPKGSVTSVQKNIENNIFELDIIDEDDFNDSFDQDWRIQSKIDFNCLERCEVIAIKREKIGTFLTVKHTNLQSVDTIMCSGFWKDIPVEKGDIIMAQAKELSQGWVIDNNNGLLIHHPDILISGTTVVSGLFCHRQAVLSQKFGKIESLPCYEFDQTMMSIGCLVHELVQKILSEQIYDLSEINKLVDHILQSRDSIHRLYASNMTIKECQQQMGIYIPKIYEFVQHYVKGNTQRSINDIKDNFKGRICQIHDIEENIWLPKLGMKGRIDITAEIKVNNQRMIVPLELKTGKTSFSMEHMGQVILYTMMMSLLNNDTKSGLLLYLRDNSIREIKYGHPEKRDLILLRNSLANYFSKEPIREYYSNLSDSRSLYKSMELPAPINHPTACMKCPYNSLCCTYIKNDPTTQLVESHPLKIVIDKVLSNITSTHIEYVMKWISFIQMEESSETDKQVLKDIWTKMPADREKKGTCISNLKLIGEVIEQYGRYQHTFVRTCTELIDNKVLQMNFTENTYIMLSTSTRINVASGWITQMQESSVTVHLNRNVGKYSKDNTFCIDKYSCFSSLCSTSLTNVAGLLGDNEICMKLRDMIIDRKPATFVEKIPQFVISINASILANLNKDQQRAVLKIMSANEYALIKGMPGTGKTQTLIALVMVLQNTGLSVLVSAHTHSAVDNILLKLVEKNIDVLRLGKPALVHPSLQHVTEEHLTTNCQSPTDLEALYLKKNVVGVTCLGAHHILLQKRKFDVCIIDESTQILQPVALLPLYSAQKFVLAGDPDQLSPIVKSITARKLGANESLFERLQNSSNTATLTLQYRMNMSIMTLANKLTYGNKLKAGNKSVETATFSASCLQVCDASEKWLQLALSQKLNESVIVFNTGPTYNLSVDQSTFNNSTEYVKRCSNMWEASIALRIVEAFRQIGVKPTNIGVIAPYTAHVSLLRTYIGNGIEINTVDQYQGRDKEIIIYSCARSLSIPSQKEEGLELLEDHRRLTVAVTRAKHKLIIIADTHTLECYTPFKRLFESISKANIIHLMDTCTDFSWKRLTTFLD